MQRFEAKDRELGETELPIYVDIDSLWTLGQVTQNQAKALLTEPKTAVDCPETSFIYSLFTLVYFCVAFILKLFVSECVCVLL